jgi:predicted translin family RNA/ssDNA-binding protein
VEGVGTRTRQALLYGNPFQIGMKIDTAEFQRLKAEMEDYDSRRDKIIKESRDITKLSKQAIYSLHREDAKSAKTQLAEAEKIIAKLLKEIKEDPSLRYGSFSGGLEEYAEAKAFLQFLEKGTLVTCKELKVVSAEEYLGGLSDLTGELMRYAVLRATKKDKAAVTKVRDLVDAIFGQFVLFDFRNSDLRKKYDSIKYNLQKVENVLYDMSMNPRGIIE